MRNRLLLLAALVALVGAPAMAFHDDGVAHCNGCHTMHNSQNGTGMNMTAYDTPGSGTAVGQGYNDLLLFNNKTDVCLNCHAGDGSYHVWGTNVLVAYDEFGAGDFMFLEEDNINDAHDGAGSPVLGYAAGHSVVSIVKGTPVDPVLATSPGGAYPSGDLACTSCHDPHGNSSFRLTYQNGQSTTSATGHVINWTSTISGSAIGFFGPGAGPETNAVHNAYNGGYSAWCGECHGDFHAASANLIHPTGELLDAVQVGIYNAYDGTNDWVTNSGGTGAFGTAYLAMVPIVDANVTTTSTTGATDGSSYVACVSCHRAHATSAMDAGRWDFNITGLAEDGDESSSFPMPNPYDEFQRSLCNKCHAKDEFDVLIDFTP